MQRTFFYVFLIILVFLFDPWCGSLYGNDPLSTGRESLIDKHRQIETKLEASLFGIPVYLESSVEKNVSRVDIYGIIKYPFASIQSGAQVPANWCDIILPHIDVRACTYERENDAWLLNTYNISKFSESLEDAYKMRFEYRVVHAQPEYLDIRLTAQKGPFNTKDHQLIFEAIPLGKDNTFVHLSHSFTYSSWGYFLMKIFGGSKAGFSVIGTNSDGNPIYTDGVRGGIERNALCYYLAVLAYLDTLKVPLEQRFEARISEWYDYSSRYKRQLYEIKKEEYLAYKRQADKVSKKLQSELNR